MGEVIRRGAEHAEAVVAVAQRKGDDPGHLGAPGDVLVGLPGDVVGGVADAEHRVEQEIEVAAAGADDEVGAGDGVGKALARPGAHLLDPQEQHHAGRDGGDGEELRDPAVQQGLHGEAEHDHGEW